MHPKIICTIITGRNPRCARSRSLWPRSSPALPPRRKAGGNTAIPITANPQVDTTTYQITDNRSVPTRIYSVRQANVVFSMIVAELEGASLEESAVVDHAIKMLSQSATVRLNIPARIPGLWPSAQD